jgi:hypothetical protein
MIYGRRSRAKWRLVGHFTVRFGPKPHFLHHSLVPSTLILGWSLYLVSHGRTEWPRKVSGRISSVLRTESEHFCSRPGSLLLAENS